MRRWLSSHHDSAIATGRNLQGISYSRLGVDAAAGGRERHSSTTVALRHVYLALSVLAIGVLVLAINVYQLYSAQRSISTDTTVRSAVPSSRPVAWIHGRNLHTGYLKHVFQVFEKLGYRTVQHVNGSANSWNVLWTHDYPFAELANVTRHLALHQMVNHFPGAGFVANKVSLATLNSSYIPRAFRMPRDKEILLEHARNFPTKIFVQKSNKHREISVKELSSLDLNQDNSFVQEFIENPYLIDGRKFDIGVYTIVTSIDPLRVYIYNGDVILRFCSADYNPFDALDTFRYVVGDNYTPTWEMPSLKVLYETLGFTMKESLNVYLRSRGHEPSILWLQVEDAIRDVLLAKEPFMITSLAKYRNSRNFFELFRFDFVLDENLNVHIMEANMSPNLSSAHFLQNRLIYDQVIYNTLSLAGLVGWQLLSGLPFNVFANLQRIFLWSVEFCYFSCRKSAEADAEMMRVSERDVSVFAEECTSCVANGDRVSCAYMINSVDHCRLCRSCISAEWMSILRAAFREHAFRHNCRRIFPPSTVLRKVDAKFGLEIRRPLSENNRLMMMWFEGKCRQDSSFC